MTPSPSEGVTAEGSATGGVRAVATGNRGRVARLVEVLCRSTRRVWWVSFILLAVTGSLWSLASPLYSGPDEPAHTVRAVSLVRGQWLGQQTEVVDNNALEVEVPATYTANPFCYVFEATVPAYCQQWPPEGGEVELLTTAGRHPPTYYALVGIPSLFNQSPASIYAMRLVSVLVSAALMASALTTLAGLRRTRLALLGFLVALTPMVLFVSGLVNPSAFEIAGAIGTWVGAFALLRAAQDTSLARPEGSLPTRPGAIPPRLVWSTAIAASVLVLSRALAPVWLAGIVVVLLIVSPWGAMRALARDRTARAGAALVALATAGQVAWIVLAKPLAQVDTQRVIEDTLWGRISGAFGRSIDYPRDMVGNVGWLDTPAPPSVAVVWLVLLLVLLALGLVAGTARQRLGIVVTLLATIVVPVAMDAMQAPRTGFVWQGRYTIPVAVGVPLLCGLVAATSRRQIPPWVSRWVVPLAAAGFVVGHGLMFVQALKRYAVGVGASWRFFDAELFWEPPLGNLALALAFGVAVILLGCWLVVARRDPEVT